VADFGGPPDPWASLSTGADRVDPQHAKAESHTVRALMLGAHEEGGAKLAAVPWVAAPVSGKTESWISAVETVHGEAVDDE
jgi:hypothetical protein